MTPTPRPPLGAPRMRRPPSHPLLPLVPRSAPPIHHTSITAFPLRWRATDGASIAACGCRCSGDAGRTARCASRMCRRGASHPR
ncbi:hypothetical protein K438DRAFT_1858861 [Mycena galopus ATCC 62051]|nr:hypothetical protein K438DRAFT_1858861 [Mycena galopus ATCC 62051]